MNTTVATLIRDIAKELDGAGIPDPGREARLIVAAGLRISMSRLSVSLSDAVSPSDEQLVVAMVADRKARKPLSHILGNRDFFKHRFHVTSAVLDPRPETEMLVEAGLSVPFERVLDLGTGSGAIIISLLAERPTARGVGSDLSKDAIAVARRNAKTIGVADRLSLVTGDWYEMVEGCFDLIVSNPPYIALDEMPDLAPELGFEPRLALTDEGDGLSAYRAIAAGAMAHLRPNGWVMVEIGPAQGADVSKILGQAGLCDVEIRRDLDGRDRVVLARHMKAEAGNDSS